MSDELIDEEIRQFLIDNSLNPIEILGCYNLGFMPTRESDERKSAVAEKIILIALAEYLSKGMAA